MLNPASQISKWKDLKTQQFINSMVETSLGEDVERSRFLAPRPLLESRSGMQTSAVVRTRSSHSAHRWMETSQSNCQSYTHQSTEVGQFPDHKPSERKSMGREEWENGVRRRRGWGTPRLSYALWILTKPHHTSPAFLTDSLRGKEWDHVGMSHCKFWKHSVNMFKNVHLLSHFL